MNAFLRSIHIHVNLDEVVFRPIEIFGQSGSEGTFNAVQSIDISRNRPLIDPACRPCLKHCYVGHYKSHYGTACKATVVICPHMQHHGLYAAAGPPTMANEQSISLRSL